MAGTPVTAKKDAERDEEDNLKDMYKADRYQKGDFEVFKISREGGPAIELIPARGGVLQQIYLGSEAKPVLHSFDSAGDLLDNDKFKQTLLFPFPNRLKDGRYMYENMTYAFPVNEPDRGNALHGLVYGEEFVVTEVDLRQDLGKIEITYIYHGQHEAYPFPFTLRTIYEISEAGFVLKAHIENTGYRALPYGFGWHPYFKTDERAIFRGQEAKLQEVNERLLPTGEESLYDFGKEQRTLTESLDNAFRISENESLNLELGHFKGQMISLKADKSFRFFQVYNPAPNIVAVEPVTCNINAMNNGDQLLHLGAGENREHRIEISLL